MERGCADFCSAFDKFVKINEKGITQIKEGDLFKIKTDLIILRGTFNYLDKREIVRLRKIVSKNTCVLLFNTFVCDVPK